MGRCVIFGGGDITDDMFVRESLREGDFLLCADSGYLHCLRLGLRPGLLLGDFDSYTGRLPDDCPVEPHDPRKDDTDTMLAVKTGFAMGFREFALFGMLGGRFDHSVANLQTLHYIARQGGAGWILDASARITAVENGSLRISGGPGESLSVFSLTTESCGVTIRGAQYPLEDARLEASFPLGVSNGFLSETVEISVRKGCLAIMTCKL